MRTIKYVCIYGYISIYLVVYDNHALQSDMRQRKNYIYIYVRLTCEQPAEESPTFLRASLPATAEERRRERAPRASPTFASRQLKRVQVSMQMKPPNIGTYHNTFNDWLSTGEDEQAVVLEMHQKGPPQKKSAR